MLVASKYIAAVSAGLMLTLAASHVLAQAATGPFDGTYKGPATSTSGGPCSNFAGIMKVENSALLIRYNKDLVVTGTVAASGAVTAQGSASGRGGMTVSNMTGKIVGPVATLVSDTPRCHYDFKLTKE